MYQQLQSEAPDRAYALLFIIKLEFTVKGAAR